MLEGSPEGPGFWSLTRYEDVRTVNRPPQLFSSEGGITLSATRPETLEFFGSMIVLDDPRHSKLRLLVQKGVHAQDGRRHRAERAHPGPRSSSPRRPSRASATSCRRFAAPLPLQIICDMLGVPAADEQQSSTGRT